MTCLILAILYLVSMFALWRYLRHPLEKLHAGIDLLNEQDFSSWLTPVGNRRADEVVTLFNRMMAQLKEERLSVRETNHFLDLLIKASPMGVIIPSTGTANPAARRAMTPDVEAALQSLALHETRVVRSAGNVFRISRHHLVDRGMTRDFFLLEQLTDEVRQAERAAYEKVIRMIVHEVNNTVAGTASALTTLTGCLEDEDLRLMAEACADRQRELSQFVTRFADVVKLPAPRLVPTPLAPRLEACTGFIASMGVEVELHCANAGEWMLDAALFDQVIVNILKNSVESGASHITIDADKEHLTIIDNGSGVAPEAAGQLFTPFFTTKPGGQGIGLLMTREILTAHHLRFSLGTGEDGLTRFEIKS